MSTPADPDLFARIVAGDREAFGLVLRPPRTGPFRLLRPYPEGREGCRRRAAGDLRPGLARRAPVRRRPRVGEDVAVHDRAQPGARPLAEPPVVREEASRRRTSSLEQAPAPATEARRPPTCATSSGAPRAAVRERAGGPPPRLLRRLHAGGDRRAPQRAARHGEEPDALGPHEAHRRSPPAKEGPAVADDRIDRPAPTRAAEEAALHWCDALEAELDADGQELPARARAAPPPR